MYQKIFCELKSSANQLKLFDEVNNYGHDMLVLAPLCYHQLPQAVDTVLS